MFRVLGPGLLFAGASVGVSHLVQSTRAGADFGLDLLLVLLLANLIKYPFFEFGPRYAVATGQNLIEGYRKIGKWAVVLFAVLTIGTMFTVQAAVTIVTAGLVGNVFNLDLNPVWISAMILMLTMVMLVGGRYRLLDTLIKYIIVLLAVSTLVAVITAAANGFQPNAQTFGNFSLENKAHLLFLIAFFGWMPSPIDITVWQSLWTLAKYREKKTKPQLKGVLFDFKVGFIGTILLAMGFLLLGALVVNGSGESLSPSGVVFSGQLIRMYTVNIGTWSYVIIAVAAITTMFSTTMTCLDAYPRVMTPLTRALFPRLNEKVNPRNERLFWFVIVVVGAVLLLSVLSSSMRTMVDIATTLSFVTAPILAILNFRVVTDKHMPREYRPKKALRIYAWCGILALSIFTLVYLVWNFLL
jgi:Mn2+/Fe2+ NRAMP family transporter